MLLIFDVDVPFDGWESYGRDLRPMATNPSIAFMGSFANDQVADVLSQIDVLVVLSIWYENSPLTIHEAFMAGIPVIASNIGGMAEHVHHMENGLLFEVGDPADLRQKTIYLLRTVVLLRSSAETSNQLKLSKKRLANWKRFTLNWQGKTEWKARRKKAWEVRE